MTQEISPARHFTDERLAVDINRLAEDIRFLKPDERAALLREAASRIASRRHEQVIVTLPDNQQISWMHGRWHHRTSLGKTWSLPLDESNEAHVPNTFYIGEW